MKKRFLQLGLSFVAAFGLALTLGAPAGAVVESDATDQPGELVTVDSSISLDATDVSTQAEAAPGAVDVYRFWSPVFNAHFYTTDAAERDTVIRKWPRQWSYEGPRFRAYNTQVEGTVPVYRFWSESMKSHFYTTSRSERDHVIATWPKTWAYEGVAYYTYPLSSEVSEAVEVHRFWSSRFRAHFYTADAAEAEHVKRTWPTTWQAEGTRFKVLPLGGGTTPVDPTPSPTVAEEMLRYVNEARAVGRYCGETWFPQAGALAMDSRLSTAARKHSEDMATNDYFSHTSQDGRSPWDRAEAEGTTARGENIAAGRSTAEGTTQQWLDSSGHCANIMNASFTHFGGGRGTGGTYRYYWTQMFR